MDKNLKIKITDTLEINDSVKARSESVYLIISNKEKCRQLLDKKSLEEGDIIDFLISLHIVLEVGLNSLFRNLSLMGIKKDVNEFEIIKNIDNINFIDKTALFIYDAKFNFNSKLAEASRYHSIIGTLRSFAEIRNRLLHGHSISSVFSEGETKHSPLRKSITPESIGSQVEKFKFILEGMRFYIDCLDSSLTTSGRESFKKEYLNDDFYKIQ